MARGGRRAIFQRLKIKAPREGDPRRVWGKTRENVCSSGRVLCGVDRVREIKNPMHL